MEDGMTKRETGLQTQLKTLDKNQAEAEIKTIVKTTLAFIGAGVNNVPPKGAMTDFLIVGLRELLGQHSRKDIGEALQLAAMGKIEFDLKLYDRPLSIAFFGELMKKFRQYKAILKNNLPKLPPAEPRPPTKEELERIEISTFKSSLEAYGRTGIVLNAGSALFKLLGGDKGIDLDTKKKLMKKAVERERFKTAGQITKQKLLGNVKFAETLQASLKDIQPGSGGAFKFYEEFVCRIHFDNYIKSRNYEEK